MLEVRLMNSDSSVFMVQVYMQTKTHAHTELNFAYMFQGKMEFDHSIFH